MQHVWALSAEHARAWYTQISIYVSSGVMLVVLGCIYTCVCMVGKGRLTFDVADLPKPFQGASAITAIR
eukprot:Skav230883  [mRNA]  locus=scaffold2765:15500:17537:- [translate_table: standard]